MRLNKIVINNFRKLSYNVSIDISDETLIVGKNNTGKTSVSELFIKFFLPKKSFRLEDFSSHSITSSLVNDIHSKYLLLAEDSSQSSEQVEFLDALFPTISMDLNISIEANDNLALIKPLLYEFTNNEELIIRLKYEFSGIKTCVDDFIKYNKKLMTKYKSSIEEVTFFEFFKRNYSNYYKVYGYCSKPNQIYEHSVDVNEISNLFNIGIISAQREVDDTSDQNLQSISNALWKYYQFITKENSDLNQEDVYKASISNIKTNLNTEYSELFKELLISINENIMGSATQSVEITSEFSIEDILKRNSKLKYKIDEFLMPESYNGLGFSNMMYMFIQLITYIESVKKENKVFNILFIEEPESHLHPQMQSTFLRKLNDIIGTEYSVFRILTTHSSYILQSADLSGVRFFNVGSNSIDVRSLSAFFEIPEFANLETFVKKYFKINTCDLFFADKAILVEGTVERMLISLLIRKFDDEHKTSLSKQHLTVIEVGGAYAHTFNELLTFLQLRTLVITDIDSVSGSHNETCKCDISEEGDDINTYTIKTSNAVIKDWFNGTGDKLFIKNLIDKCKSSDTLIKTNKDGEEVKKITFQRPTDDRLVWGRTFEEQFIIENATSLEKSIKACEFQSLIEAISKTKDGGLNKKEKNEINESILKDHAYEIVRNINKTNFALDLLMYNDWKIPQYIKEGLLWLEK